MATAHGRHILFTPTPLLGSPAPATILTSPSSATGPGNFDGFYSIFVSSNVKANEQKWRHSMATVVAVNAVRLITYSKSILSAFRWYRTLITYEWVFTLSTLYKVTPKLVLTPKKLR